MGSITPDLADYVKVTDMNNALNTKVNVSDMRKPASDVAGIEEVNAKQDKIGYTPADDSKVAHLSGANNFDTVPTVNNNPLLLASSLPSDIARTGQDQEFTGKNTFYTAPIDKTTGNPYITKDGVPAVPSTLADTTKDTNFTGKLQKSGIDVATTADVSKATTAANAYTDSKIKSSSDTGWQAAPSKLNGVFGTGKVRIKNNNLYIFTNYGFSGAVGGVVWSVTDTWPDFNDKYVLPDIDMRDVYMPQNSTTVVFSTFSKGNLSIRVDSTEAITQYFKAVIPLDPKH